VFLTFLNSWRRSIATLAVSGVVLGFALSGWRVSAWEALQPLFAWLETSWFGAIGKTWGGVFAVVEAMHLLAMALLGGALLVSDGRLLGLLLRDVPVPLLLRRAHRLFVIGLIAALATGLFMACAVATKIYFLPVFWIKMLALAVGVLFTFAVKRPLLADGIEDLDPWVVRAVAVASLTVWFTVAASGRWIGFSG
jgi:hypothetical protein